MLSYIQEAVRTITCISISFLQFIASTILGWFPATMSMQVFFTSWPSVYTILFSSSPPLSRTQLFASSYTKYLFSLFSLSLSLRPIITLVCGVQRIRSANDSILSVRIKITGHEKDRLHPSHFQNSTAETFD
ncbi:hypothetical protein BDV26DRAFT_166852 [Aspergillus bertholletiae]|uniref:Uncharacterized protein n=1 Tax=Aspergillus bertholletiae TaxID=1226010 RepID=A0A5N7BCD1_9EURO|nr:hypothetical protein BDV26DRAFT_166852 [Aspergillus bertholletiae]